MVTETTTSSSPAPFGGHSERSAVSVLKHYLALTGDMADAAIQKLTDWEEVQSTDHLATDES